MKFLLLLASSLFAWDAPPTAPRLEAARISEAPSLDGRIDEAVWAQARPGTGFTQKTPAEGAPPSERTEIRVLYDDEALYIGVTCEQRTTPIASRLSRRDREIEADQVSVIISSRRDGRTAFQFGLTASGVQNDGLYFDDDHYSGNWDETWEGEVAATSSGWSAELRIPLRILRFDELPVQEWGFNVRRFISARQETSEWSFSPRREPGVVSRFGRLDNLVGLKPNHGIELRPFALAEVRQVQPGFVSDPRQAGVSRRLSAGLDAKAHPTQNLTIDATVNPDFGQVEADEVVLNLTNTETVFSEKRPFFQEGTDVFQSSRNVVYTRRIGAVPASPALPAGERPISRLSPTPIYGALKVTGRPLPRLTLGALSALTGPQTVTTANADGLTAERVAAPLTFWNVLRLRTDFGNGAHVGFLGTATNRNESFDSLPTLMSDDGETRTLCPGGQQVAQGDRCFRDAYVGGFDGLWRSPSRTYSLSAQAMAALIQNGPDRTLRDGTVLGSGATDPFFAVTAEKEGGDLQGRIGGQFTGRHVDFNDLGLMQRQNEWRLWLTSTYRTTVPWGPALSTLTDLSAYQQTNLDGIPVGRWLRFGTNWQLKNFWWVGVHGVLFPTSFDDREVGNGAALEHKPRTGTTVELMTDPRREVMAILEASWHYLAGGESYEAEATLRLKLFSRLDLDLAPNVTVRTGEPRYISRQSAGESTSYLLGELAARSVGATLRLTWTFTPRLTLQTYGQAFLVSRRYSDFATFTSSDKKPLIRLRELETADAPAQNPDGSEAVFNANVLLRWEYRPGSTLFLAYSRSQRPSSDMTGDLLMDDFRSLSRSLSAGPAANVVLLKLAYWWG